MIVIGELINGMYKAVGKAIRERDAAVIQELAKEQVRAGAHILDVNTGPYSTNPREDMIWLVETIQKTSDAGLCIDSTKPDVMEEGLKRAKTPPILNSISADDAKMATFLPMAKKYNARVIALTMDKSGVPNDRASRIELAAKIVTVASEHGIPADSILIDPIVLPVNVAQTQGLEVLESIREFRMLSDPSPRTVVGLSNVSQGTKQRPLINRTFLAMAIAQGLSAAILDPLDTGLMDAMITAELVLNRHIYCDSFLNAYRKG